MNDRLAMGRSGRAGALALALLGLVLGPRPAMAQQDYPNRALHVFIGFPAGSGADILGRYFAAQLEKLAGKPVVVENKPGANSNIAAGIVATRQARRLQHSVHRLIEHGRQPIPVQESAVRHGEGFHSGRLLRRNRVRAHRRRQVADQDRGRAHRLSEIPQAEQVRRHQSDRDPLDRILQAAGGGGCRARRLPHRAGSAAGRGGRHARFHDHGRHLRGRADQGRKDPRAGGDHGAADRGASRRADHDGGGCGKFRVQPVVGRRMCRPGRRSRSWPSSAPG